MEINLKDITAIVQICFYIIGATIAILTYRSAKRGLLNTVNTEYQKRVMDHLETLSESLHEEFNFGRKENRKDQYDYYNSVEEHIKLILDSFENHLEKNNPRDTFKFKQLTFPRIFEELIELAVQVESDPFLPDHISKYVTKYYVKNRTINLRMVMREETQYLVSILRSQNEINRDRLLLYAKQSMKLHLEGTGYGFSQNKKHVMLIRTMIKEHLKSFNPLS